jgi:hypothetical protein
MHSRISFSLKLKFNCGTLKVQKKNFVSETETRVLGEALLCQINDFHCIGYDYRSHRKINFFNILDQIGVMSLEAA